MVKAFVEILSAIVRVGPDTDQYGKPFEFAVGVSSTDGRTAVVKALVAKGDFMMSYARAIIKALKEDIKGFEKIVWERIK